MFRGDDHVVTQWDHSRLSGELAALFGAATGIDDPLLFGAIALHDWPHFAHHMFDTVEIGNKSRAQHLELLDVLDQPLPLSPLTELIVRMHWKRMTDDVGDFSDQEEVERIDALRQEYDLSWQHVARLDRWTDFCDTLAFHLARGATAEGKFQLPHPHEDRRVWQLRWSAGPTSLRVGGFPASTRAELSLLLYEANEYPDLLEPSVVRIACQCETTTG